VSPPRASLACWKSGTPQQHPGGAVMILKWVSGPLLFVSLPALLTAAEPSWEGKLVILTKAGVKLQAPEGKDIAPENGGRCEGSDVLGEEAREGPAPRPLASATRMARQGRRGPVRTGRRALHEGTDPRPEERPRPYRTRAGAGFGQGRGQGARRLRPRDWGRPSELAGLCAFLASDACQYTHGSVVVADGGWLSR
jgi:hypothetical protein